MGRLWNRIADFYARLESLGAKGEMLADVKGRLDKIDAEEKKSRFYNVLSNGRFAQAYSMLEEISKEGLSEELIQQLREELYDNFNVYFQCKVWYAMGSDISFHGNPEHILEEAIMLHSDKEMVDEWRRQIRSAIRTRYLRMLRNVLLADGGLTRAGGLVTMAEKKGVYDELLAEMRAMVAEAVVPEVRHQLERRNYNKAQTLVKGLNEIKCDVPANLQRDIDDGLMEQNRERFHLECLACFSSEEIPAEKEQEIRDNALKYGVSEETLNQWREEAKK